MKFKDAIQYRKVTGKRPGNTIMAFTEPKRPHQVILYGEYRLQVVKELTREEFIAELRGNLRKPNAVAGEGTTLNERVELDSMVDVAEPGPDYRFFYRMEII